MSTTNETGALGLTPNAPHEKPTTTPQSITEGNPRCKSTRRRPRGPDRWRSLSALVRDELLEVFIDTRKARGGA
jgi:hypothetical protein